MIPFADGSDLAASVRNPAAFCGLVGLRTTPGLVPADPFDPLPVVGPIARTAEDAALLLAGMCGPDSGRPLARPDRAGDFLDLRPASLRGLRVAWTFDLGDLPVQPEVRAVLGAARDRLEQAGCEVADHAPALADADEVFQTLRAALMAGMAPLLRAHRDQIKATLAWNIEKGIALTGEQIAAARAGHAAIFERVRSFLADGRYDVLALPTVQVVPFDVDTEWVREINGEPMATYIDWMRSCSRITVSAHPAVSVPAGLTEPRLTEPRPTEPRLTEPRPTAPPAGRPPAGRPLRRRPPPPRNRRRRHGQLMITKDFYCGMPYKTLRDHGNRSSTTRPDPPVTRAARPAGWSRRRDHPRPGVRCGSGFLPTRYCLTRRYEASRPGNAWVLPRQNAARSAEPCMASAPNVRSRWSLTATRPR